MIIQKNINKNIKPELIQYYKIINKINDYTIPNLFYVIKKKIIIKLNYNLILSDNPNEYIEELGYDDNYKIILTKIDKSLLIKYKDYDLHRLFQNYDNYKKIYNMLPENIKKQKNLFNPLTKVFNIYNFLNNNNEISPIEILATIKNYGNLVKIKNEIKLLNFTYSKNHNNELIINFMKQLFPNIQNIYFNDINITLNDEKSLFKTKLYNVNEIKSVNALFKKLLIIL
jgi:hypothetical protein